MFLLISILTFAQTIMPSDANREEIQNSSINNESFAKGYQGIIEIGYAMGVGEYGMNNLKLNFINSVRCNPYFSIGLGIGLRKKYDKTEFYEKYKWPGLNDVFFPIFLDLRTNFLNKKVSPYLALGLGGYIGTYGFWDGVRGGFFLNPSAGVRFKISDRSVINAAIDYEMENVVFWDEIPSTLPRENVGSLGINIGISF